VGRFCLASCSRFFFFFFAGWTADASIFFFPFFLGAPQWLAQFASPPPPFVFLLRTIRLGVSESVLPPTVARPVSFFVFKMSVWFLLCPIISFRRQWGMWLVPHNGRFLTNFLSHYVAQSVDTPSFILFPSSAYRLCLDYFSFPKAEYPMAFLPPLWNSGRSNSCSSRPKMGTILSVELGTPPSPTNRFFFFGRRLPPSNTSPVFFKRWFVAVDCLRGPFV